eukprot:999161-Pelagomonas_calceolata.AAC.1
MYSESVSRKHMHHHTCVSGQDSPTHLMYGRLCLMATPPEGPSTINTKLMLPSPTYIHGEASLLEA